MLGNADYTQRITGGQLRLSLGCDLFDELAALTAPGAGPRTVVLHPVLEQVYKNERELLERAPPRRALLAEGGLFVDDLADALRDEDYAVYSLDTARLSLEELTLTFERVKPALVAAINYTEGLAEFCESQGVPLLCWEVDPTLERLGRVAMPLPRTRIFTYRRAHVLDFRAAGFPAVEFLALATNPVRRAPVTMPPPEAEKYAALVSFVGASMMDRVGPLRRDFVRVYATFKSGGQAPTEAALAACQAEATALLDELLALQRADFTRYLIPTLLGERAPGFQAFCKRPGALDAEQILGELAAGEKRRDYVAALRDLAVEVWGDRGWNTPELADQYRGSAGHFVELNKIYTGTRVNVDVGRLYQMDIVTMRVFDVLACGGFLLAEKADALLEFFTPGVHLDVYADREELALKAAYYLRNPRHAARIAAQGRALVIEKHTVAERVAHMLATLR
jgi:spore maturation protein CgeB